jgi:transcriptional regulator with XRE-family HTH domain
MEELIAIRKRYMEAVQSLRMLKRIKQDSLAKALGIDQSTYSRMERGEIAVDIAQLHLIAAELKVSILLIAMTAYKKVGTEYRGETISHLIIEFLEAIDGIVKLGENDKERIMLMVEAWKNRS